MRLFWHQRDLRTRDNVGLAAAAERDAVVPVYVHDPDVLAAVGERKRAFLARTARALRERYRSLGSDLVVASGAPSDVLPDLVEEFGVDVVHYNRHYHPDRRTRQRRVDEALRAAGADVERSTDLVLVDPDRLAPSYPSHGAFHDDWRAEPTPDPRPAPAPDALADVADDGSVPEPDVDVDLPAAGYRAARDRLDGFLDDGIRTYADTRDDLERAVEAPTRAVSRLSPYLASGAIGIREVWADATEAYTVSDGDARRNVDKYRYELTWREANYHLLHHAPDLRSANYREFPNAIAWRNVEREFDAWTAGETGYPLVDAGMRQLDAEGYVHNRPRQVVASFLTKHLLVDWRWGERHFARKLVDYDPASNAGNWQWVASTGTDTVDVRIFDPVAQMAKYDPDARFVREYVPELDGVPAETVVDWPTLPAEERAAVAPAYPDPIVDRDAAYERANRVFETALGKR